MSDAPDPLADVARNLRTIVELHGDIAEQAAHTSTNREMPGGDAMVMLGNVANLEAWLNIVDHADRVHFATCLKPHHRKCRWNDHVGDEAAWLEPPLQTLLFWSEQWRVEHGRTIDTRPTVATEARFLSAVLAWAYKHEPHFDDFARDVETARIRVENVLRAGEREEKSKVECIDCAGVRLVKTWADKAVNDHWRCPRCKRKYDASAYARAKIHHLSSPDADRFVRILDAVDAIDRPPSTVRGWLRRCEVWSYCDVTTRQVWVHWPSLRDLADNKAARRERRKSA